MIALFVPHKAAAQFNTDRLMVSGRSALYYEDYVLSIQYFNQVLTAKPYLYEPWFFVALPSIISTTIQAPRVTSHTPSV